jgi:hypothetical protein
VAIKDRIGQHGHGLGGGLAPAQLAPQHGQRGGRRQTHDLVIDDQRLMVGGLATGRRRPAAGRRPGQRPEREVLQRA